MGSFCPCGNCCPDGGEPGKEFPRNKGHPQNRKFTDYACFIYFVLYTSMMACLIAVGFYYGKPARLSHGVDYGGQVCGVDQSVASFPYAFWCGTIERDGEWPKALNDQSIVCVEKCPTGPAEMTPCLMPAIKNFTGMPRTVVQKLPDGTQNVETLRMTVTQSIVKQPAYKTEAFSGKFCVPTHENEPLRESLLRGPWAGRFRYYSMVSSVMACWFVVLGAMILALIFGFIYIYCLSEYAGPIMFASMVLSSLMTLVIGLLFVWAMFVGDDTNQSWYCKNNPLYSMYVGWEARWYSIGLGVVFVLFSICLGCMTAGSMKHIDEMVGIVSATCECLENVRSLFWWPLIQAACFLVYIALLFAGLMFVASYGWLDESSIRVNEHDFIGLWRTYKSADWMYMCIVLYLIGCVWCIEVFVQFGHWVVSYAVALWYFTKGRPKDMDPGNKLSKLTKDAKWLSGAQMMDVRVAGVDANYGNRPASKVTTDAGEFLFVNVQKKGPGLGRNDVVFRKFVKDKAPVGATFRGICICLWYHTGSLAMGAWPIFFSRFLRIPAACISAQLSRQGENPLSNVGMSEQRSLESAGCLKIFTQFLDQAVGKWNKMAYMQQVLGGGTTDPAHHHAHGAPEPDWCCFPKACCPCFGDGGHGGHDHGHGDHHEPAEQGFMNAADAAFEMIVTSLGTISYLSGACFIYEAFGTLCISLMCTTIATFVLNGVSIFNDPTSEYVVQDKLIALLVIGFCSGVVAFFVMATFNHTADCLLYCIGWNRKTVRYMKVWASRDQWQKMSIGHYCPQTLRDILPAYEMNEDFEDGMTAHAEQGQASRQFDALVAAMNSGVASVRTGATQYGPGTSYQQVPAAGMFDHTAAAIGDHMQSFITGRRMG